MYQLASQLPYLEGFPNTRVSGLNQRGKPAMMSDGVVYLGFLIRTNDLYNILGNAKADFITSQLRGDAFDYLSPMGLDWWAKANHRKDWYVCRYLSPEIAPRVANLIYQELTNEETNQAIRHNLKVVGLGTTSYVPNVPIHFSGSIRIEGTDDETFIDEHYDNRWSLSTSSYLDANPWQMFYKEAKWGGECRVEANVFVRLQELGTINVKVSTKFYEGVTESTGDLEDWDSTHFEIYYPPARGQYGETVSKSINLYNSEAGGGDTAKVTVRLSAAMSW